MAVHHGPAEPSGALATARLQARSAAAAGAELLLLPQLFVDAAAGELSDGPAARELGAIARDAGIALACGYAESCTGRQHDALLLIDGRGCALANYRRTHLAPELDEPRFAPGAWLNIARLGERRVGLLLGIDIDGPEAARSLALAGAEIVLVATTVRPGGAGLIEAVLPARAVENGVALAFANGDAAAGAPASRLVDPTGLTLASTSRPGELAVAMLSVGTRGARQRWQQRRRPRLYQRLVAPMPDEEGPRL